MPEYAVNLNRKHGFTLLELSIVLVIIGLIIGGILTGRDLITAAENRAQISQIEAYRLAMNTFHLKYHALPGDINAADAASVGLAPRGIVEGSGDGDGQLLGIYAYNTVAHCGYCEGAGELIMFWRDLSDASLISGSFTSASSTTVVTTDVAGGQLANYLPTAKVAGQYIYVWSGGNFVSGLWQTDGKTYFGLSAVTHINGPLHGGAPNSDHTLPTLTAYNLDQKVDDGLPQTGTVTAQYLDSNISIGWVDGDTGPSSVAAHHATSATCYDDRGITGAPRQYSIGENRSNCALSFQFE